VLEGITVFQTEKEKYSSSVCKNFVQRMKLPLQTLGAGDGTIDVKNDTEAATSLQDCSVHNLNESI